MKYSNGTTSGGTNDYAIPTKSHIPESTQEERSGATKSGVNHANQPQEDTRDKAVHTVTSSTCIPIEPKRLEIHFLAERINGIIQYMHDHALIGKFIGFWLTEKALYGWINAKWKQKGQVTLQLGPKGFFDIIFTCLERKNRVMDGGHYFFNAPVLFL